MLLISIEGIFYLLIFFILTKLLLSKNYQTDILNPYQKHILQQKSSGLPQLFPHVTDIHINSIKDKNASSFRNLLQIIQKYKIKNLIISGDLVDNWGTKNNIIKFHQQYKPDHHLYRKCIEEAKESFENIIDIPGNHDEAAVNSYFSKDHCFLDYSFYYSSLPRNLENFELSTIKINDILFILFNPIPFPSDKMIYNFLVFPKPELLNKLEKILEDTENEKYRVLVTHFPADSFSLKPKSSSNRNYKEIIENNKIDLILVGHVHPKNSLFIHHNDSLEVVLSDFKKKEKFGLISLDKNQLIYHEMNVNNPKRIIVTNPAPESQSSLLEKEIDLRVVIFGEKDKVMINSMTEMEFVNEIEEGINLYHLNLTLQNGRNHFEIQYKNNVEKIDIFVGKNVRKERFYGIWKKYNVISFFFVILSLLLLYISFPFDIINTNKVCMKNLLMKNPLLCRIFVFLVSIFPLIYHFKSDLFKRNIENLAYFMFVSFPFLFLLSLKQMKTQNHISFVFSMLLIIGNIISLRFLTYSKIYFVLSVFIDIFLVGSYY